MVDTARGDTFITARSSCDLATPGSPTSSTLTSPAEGTRGRRRESRHKGRGARSPARVTGRGAGRSRTLATELGAVLERLPDSAQQL